MQGFFSPGHHFARMQGNLPPEAQEKLEQLQDLQETAQEVAVQKEDAVLDAIRETKKRVEDIEMWL